MQLHWSVFLPVPWEFEDPASLQRIQMSHDRHQLSRQLQCSKFARFPHLWRSFGLETRQDVSQARWANSMFPSVGSPCKEKMCFQAKRKIGVSILHQIILFHSKPHRAEPPKIYPPHIAPPTLLVAFLGAGRWLCCVVFVFDPFWSISTLLQRTAWCGFVRTPTKLKCGV